MIALCDRRVVDVDAVGDDRHLAAGLGELVELVGDPSGFGRRAGAELGRQHREGRGPDRCRDDQ